MKSLTIENLSERMGLKLRSHGDLLGAKIVVIGPESAVYGMVVTSFRITRVNTMLILKTQNGEKLTLISVNDGENYRWELKVPREFYPVPIMKIEFSF
jgi:hypothetical protein